eukprot:scaffold34002_cov65-Phaeocystis_antarctica.AAC.4
MMQLVLVWRQREYLLHRRRCPSAMQVRGSPLIVELVKARLHDGHARRTSLVEEVIRVYTYAHDPVVLQSLARIHPPTRVDGEQPRDEILGFVRDVRPILWRELEAAALDARVHLVVRLAVEGRRGAQQDVDDHPHRPHVTRRAVARGAA